MNSLEQYKKSFKYDIKADELNDNGIAVIVETREIDTLEWTIKNVAFYTGWNIRCYCSEQNQHLIPDFVDKHIIEDIDYHKYNEMLTSVEFWESLGNENVLIFQSDSFMLKNGLENFMMFDYVGAPWQWSYDYKNCSIFQPGGNGGISYRKTSTMIRIIRNFPPTEYRVSRINPKGNEDMYFSLHLESVNARIPSLSVQKKFSVETMFNEEPLCVHAIDKCLMIVI